MKKPLRLNALPLQLLTAAVLAWGLAGTAAAAGSASHAATAKPAVKKTAQPAGKPAAQSVVKSSARAGAKGTRAAKGMTMAKASGPGRGATAAKDTKGTKGTKGTKVTKAAKGTRAAMASSAASAGAVTVITRASPPLAELARLPATAIHTGCLTLPASPDAAAVSGPDMQQLHALLDAAQVAIPAGADSPRCAPYVAVSMSSAQPGAPLQPASLALLPGDERHAVVVTSQPGTRPAAAAWHDLSYGLPPAREVWLRSPAWAGGGLEGSDSVPTVLAHELSLLVKHMRKQSGAGDTAIVRALVQGEDDTATLAAVELIDPATGQALDSAVWVARSDEPGAYISSRGVEYERMLWQSPVDYRRISRGIGASNMVVHKRVLVPLKTKKGRKPKSKVVVRAFQYKSQHIGIDFAADTGTPVVSVAEGEVLFAGWRGGYGNLVIVQHGSDVTTYYGHLSAFSPGLQEGAPVRRGQEIGLVGSTGFSTGPHLHFEIRKGARYMDPANPAQQLPLWTLSPQEHETLLTRLLQLEVTRSQAFQLTARAPQPRGRIGEQPEQPVGQ